MRAEFTAIAAAMAKLAGYTGNGGYFLRVNAGATAHEAITTTAALAALAPNSAALAAAVTDATGTGVFVRATSPTLVTPLLGTPTSGVLTNCTGTAAGLTAGNVTTNANLTGHVTSVGNAAVLGSFTSAQLATALTDETGSGAAVFATNPILVTPNLGTPSACVATNLTGTATALNIGGNAATATAATTAINLSGPKFRVYLSSNQSLSSGSPAKIAFNSETSDTNNNFDSATNNRFTPSVAGYYQINWLAAYIAAGTSLTQADSRLHKNGVAVSYGSSYAGSAIDSYYSSGSTLIYMNGTTDYLELFAYAFGTTPSVFGGSAYSNFSGALL
jgi:hypothetical protein